MLIKASILVQLNQCHSYPKSVCRLKSKKEEWQDISFKVLSVSFQSLVFQNSFVFGKYHEEASKSQHIVQKPSLCQLSMCLSSVPTSRISSPHRGHCKICASSLLPLSNTVLLFWFCMNDIWWLPMNGCWVLTMYFTAVTKHLIVRGWANF